MFDQNGYLGGHSNTVEVAGERGPVAVDTGFIVYNALNYPNLVQLFQYLGVATEASDMSFAVSLRGGALEYAGTNLAGLFAQASNLGGRASGECCETCIASIAPPSPTGLKPCGTACPLVVCLTATVTRQPSATIT